VSGKRKKLSPTEERFAVALAEGRSQADAYRLANPKSVRWKHASLYSKASELMAEERLQLRVAELQRELAAQSLWRREHSVIALKQVIAEAKRKSDIIAAVRELNAMHGYHAPQRIEHAGAIAAIERRIIDVVVQGDAACGVDKVGLGEADGASARADASITGAIATPLHPGLMR